MTLNVLTLCGSLCTLMALIFLPQWLFNNTLRGIYIGWGWDTGYPRPIFRTANVNVQIVAHYILCQSLFSCICSFWVLQWFVVSRETYGVGVGTRAPPPHYNDMRYSFISSNDNATWLGAWCPCFRRSWIDVLLKSFVVRCLCEKSKMKAFTG